MKRTTPPPQKPATTSSEQDNTAPKKLEKKIQRWNPDRKRVDSETIRISKQQAARLFRVLFQGFRIHRRNCDQFGFVWNGPLHSIVAKLEEVYDTPVERQRIYIETGEDRIAVCEYWFTDEVRKALGDLFEREALIEETRRGRERGYIKAAIGRAKTLTKILASFRKLRGFHPDLLAELVKLGHEIIELAEAANERTH